MNTEPMPQLDPELYRAPITWYLARLKRWPDIAARLREQVADAAARQRSITDFVELRVAVQTMLGVAAALNAGDQADTHRAQELIAVATVGRSAVAAAELRGA